MASEAGARWTARFMPLVVTGLLAYAAYVVVGELCAKYLLDPQAHGYFVDARPDNGMGIIVADAILLAVVYACYVRLVWTTVVQPGYIARREEYFQHHPGVRLRVDESKYRKEKSKKDEPYSRPAKCWVPAGPSGNFTYNVADYVQDDCFVSKDDGRPPWCSHCLNFKPGRTHHCRQIDRCIDRYDHFCPWAAGPIGRDNYKFFVQFIIWVSVYCFFNAVVMAVYIGQQVSLGIPVNPHFAVVLALGGLMGILVSSLVGTHLYYIWKNITTIEALTQDTRIWTLAIFLKHPPPKEARADLPYRIVDNVVALPLPKKIPIYMREEVTLSFAILYSEPGENPFDMGPIANFADIMGPSWWDLLFPLRKAPNTLGTEAIGPVMRRMIERAGVIRDV